MNEKEIIKGKPAKKLQMLVLAIGLVFLALFLLMYIADVGECRTGEHPYTYINFTHTYETRYRPVNILDILFFHSSSYAIVSIVLYLGLVLSVIGTIIFASLAKTTIAVTNKRVYGNATWGKRVDLPFDSISGVSTSAYKGLAVASPSGTAKFKAIDNYEDVYKTISNLLVERQNKEKTIAQTTIKQEIQQSDADELGKFKELLDKGIITQEEFDAKKKQLLGL